ncbi:MAG: Na/Pi cotransporter family protein [Proteobacteria bacterium]|nr:MAG: Na/Pi cotransporter family protein [Pseudomonadota bacterium]
MSATLLLVHIFGTVALLLWGMGMVRTGVERAYGARLRVVLKRWLDRRLVALASGLCVTLALQSSTATALLVNGFVVRGAVATSAALALLLGADIGTTLMVAVLSFDLSWLSPFLIGVGFVMHTATSSGSVKQYARIVMGLGLALLALQLLRGYTGELTDSHVLPIVLRALTDEPVIAVLVFAVVTWLLHSSLAAVLFTVSLASAGVIEPRMALILVLGANLGAGLPAYSATAGLAAPARRVPVGNLLFRATGVIVLLPFIELIDASVASLGLSAGLVTLVAHIAFNVLIALVFLPFLGPVAGFLDARFPVDTRDIEEAGGSRLLDQDYDGDIDTALSAASRETIRLCDLVEDMYRDLITALCENDRALAKDIAARDDRVDRLHREIKLFVTRATREEMDEEQSRRATQILTFVTDLEHIADIVESSAGHARRKAVRGLHFSPAGISDLKRMHENVMKTMHTAVDVFMSSDAEQAERLIREKRSIGRMEKALERAHLHRLRDGLTESIETSSFHQDVLRDLKRIHSHLVAVAYAIAGSSKDAESEVDPATSSGSG